MNGRASSIGLVTAMVEWKIQDTLIDVEKSFAVKTSCDKFNVKASAVSIVPFQDTLAPLEKNPAHIFYGSTKLIGLAHKEEYPGIWYGCGFDYAQWQFALGERLLNQHEYPIEGFPTLEYLAQRTDSNVFIRPRYDLKPFVGGAVDKVSTWAEEQIAKGVPKDTECIIAKLKPISHEYRFVFIGAALIAMSAYRIKGVRKDDPDVPLSIIEFAQTTACKWTPEPVCVMDICISNEKPYVLEFNCFNCSGFYAMDVDTIVEKVSAYKALELHSQEEQEQ